MASSSTTPGSTPPPVLRTTRFDVVSSLLIAVVIGLAVALGSLVAVWSTTWEWSDEVQAVPVELVENPGGDPLGALQETLQLETPEDASEDPSLAEVEDDESRVQETIDSVVELSEQAAEQTQEQFERDAVDAGQPGSSAGSGRRPLGFGPGDGGLPREQRWFVAFSDSGSLEEYVRQLEHFGIELAVLQPGGKLVFLTNLGGDPPGTRVVTQGSPDWFYFTWRGGGRKQADLQLFEKADVDVGASQIFHFYPPAAQEALARAEVAHAGRDPATIRRTYFVVREAEDGGYQFVVTRQSYF